MYKPIPGVMNLNSSNLCHICTDMFVKILAKPVVAAIKKPRQPEGKTHVQTDDDFSNNKKSKQAGTSIIVYLPAF